MPAKDPSAAVKRWRQRTKAVLVAIHGGKCLDCGYVGPPFMFDFDHVETGTKSFGISDKAVVTKNWYELLLESLKCELVCANCHRMRTHMQRCGGCEHCDNASLAQSG